MVNYLFVFFKYNNVGKGNENINQRMEKIYHVFFLKTKIKMFPWAKSLKVLFENTEQMRSCIKTNEFLVQFSIKYI